MKPVSGAMRPHLCQTSSSSFLFLQFVSRFTVVDFQRKRCNAIHRQWSSSLHYLALVQLVHIIATLLAIILIFHKSYPIVYCHFHPFPIVTNYKSLKFGTNLPEIPFVMRDHRKYYQKLQRNYYLPINNAINEKSH